MASYRTFTTSRQMEPDPVALLAALRAIAPTATYNAIGSVYHVKTASVLNPGSVTSIQNAIDTAPALTPQRVAQNAFDAQPLLERAKILTTLDQFNFIRSKLVPPQPAITEAQMLAAIRTKAGEIS